MGEPKERHKDGRTNFLKNYCFFFFCLRKKKAKRLKFEKTMGKKAVEMRWVGEGEGGGDKGRSKNTSGTIFIDF